MNWTDLSTEYPHQNCLEEKSIVEQFASQASSRPDAIAVESQFGVLNYGQLESYANRLAGHLQAIGVGPDVVVGLCLQRSPALIVSALAVLKAGGAYLPLDPSDPAKRLELLFSDARVVAVITTPQARLQHSKHLWKSVLVDDLGKLLERDCPALLAPAPSSIEPANLAYVIYTSGSTGQPKGVEITHAALSNLVRWHQETFEVTSADRATQLARVGFDAAVWEIWPYITKGASLHLPPQQIVNEPEALKQWLLKTGITISFVPTPMAERLLPLEWPAKTHLRLLLTGGDVLHRSPPPDLPFAVINNYGPTECAVVTTSGIVLPHRSTDRLPSIGVPITNSRVYILDKSMRPVSAGTPGELYIGGPSVARGYRNQPELTAQKFIPDPFSSDPTARLFKTGDRAQSLPDGQIAFLGRLDEQLKVRGFRIEPHEIVAALDTHPAIAQSAVIAQDLNPEERRLVAYFVYSNGARLTVNQIQDFLLERLPDYMVPAVFVRLDNMPLTANGKIDRTALPPATENNIIRDEIVRAPETELEKAVASILAPLLGINDLDVHANFFSLGGHSLLGTQLIARIRDTFGVELPLRVIFEAPTVADLSAQIDSLLLARLESINDAEAQRLLDSKQAAYA